MDPRYEYQLVVAEKAFDQDEGVSARSGGEPVRIVLRRRGVFRGRVWGEDQPLKNFCVDGNEVTSADGRIDFGAAGIKTIAERFIKTKP